jgi:ferredoxin
MGRRRRMGSGRWAVGRGTHRRGTIRKRWGRGAAAGLLPGASPAAALMWSQVRGQRSAEKFAILKTQERATEDQISAVRAPVRKLVQGRAISPVVAVVDPDRCIACGACQGICPTGAISIGEIAEIDPVRCMGCGQCVARCPQEAMSLPKA